VTADVFLLVINTNNWRTIMPQFRDYELPASLAKTLDFIGFIEPTKIQQKAIPHLLEGRDLIACAETGSGKTGAYLIPMITALLEDPKAKGMVLAPTRELAQQIAEFLKTLVKKERGFNIATLVGGQDMRKQFRALERNPQVIVATPGRLIDHLKRKTAHVTKVKCLVLDEGDRMIDMGFAPQLEQILKYLPKERQTSFFTATLDKKVQNLAGKYLDKPASIMINNSRPVSTIKQTVITLENKHKEECILDELAEREGSVIVFLKTKHKTNQLTKYLADYGVQVGLIHGGRTQGQRNRAISSFKKGETRVLCATDVAARGLDVPHVEHVINFDLPMQDEDYVHRIGRTARNGAEGEAVSLVTPHEHHDWNRLVKKYDIPDALIPTSDKPKRHGKKKPKKKLSRNRNRRGNASGKKFSDKKSSKKSAAGSKSKFGKEGSRKKDHGKKNSQKSHGKGRRPQRGKGQRSERSFS
jgi:ATP-dependent RNA helicase DeaD